MLNEARNSSSENQKLSPDHLRDKRFIDTHRETLDLLFEGIGISTQTTDPLVEIIAETQPWARGDHHDSVAKFDLSNSEQANMLGVMDDLGLLGEVPPAGGEYDQILILGGEQHSNHVRIDYLEHLINENIVSLSEDGVVVSLGGKRPLKGREIVDIASDFIALEGSKNTWVNKIKKAEIVQSLEEDSAMRLALMARFAGDIVLTRMHIRLEHPDPISHREMLSEDGETKLVFINAPAVIRPLGPARHTTESTLQEWLKLYPPKQGARVLFVSNNPYIIRTARNAATALIDRQDIQLDYCGAPAVEDGTIFNRCMGEIARNLYEDFAISE